VPKMKQGEVLVAAEAAPSEQVCAECGKQLTIMPPGTLMQDEDEEPWACAAVIADPVAGLPEGQQAASYSFFLRADDARRTFAAHATEHEPKPEPKQVGNRQRPLDLDKAHEDAKFKDKDAAGWTRLNLREPMVVTHDGAIVDAEGKPLPGKSPYTVDPGVYYADGFEDADGNRLGLLVPVNYTPDEVS